MSPLVRGMTSVAPEADSWGGGARGNGWACVAAGAGAVILGAGGDHGAAVATGKHLRAGGGTGCDGRAGIAAGAVEVHYSACRRTRAAGGGGAMGPVATALPWCPMVQRRDLTPPVQRASSVAQAVGLPASVEPVLPLVLGKTATALLQRASGVAQVVGLPASAQPVLPILLRQTAMALVTDLVRLRRGTIWPVAMALSMLQLVQGTDVSPLVQCARSAARAVWLRADVGRAGVAVCYRPEVQGAGVGPCALGPGHDGRGARGSGGCDRRASAAAGAV